MSLGAPKAPDPAAVAQAQAGYNTQAAQQQQKLNMINQTTPYGSLTYSADPNSPGGYTASTALTPDLQALASTQQQTARNLAQNTSGMYSNPPNLDINSTLGTMQNWFENYYDPIFKQQQSNLDAQLRNQGFSANADPNNSAYANAQNLLSRNQNDARNQFFMGAEPLAFNQAVQQYQLPLATIQALLTQGTPNPLSFQTTPTEQIVAPNYAQAAQNQYAGNMANYQNMINGIAKIGGAAVGGIFGGPLGASIGGGLGNMFGSGPGASLFTGQTY